MGFCQRQSSFKAIRIFPFAFNTRIFPALTVLRIAGLGSDTGRVRTQARPWVTRPGWWLRGEGGDALRGVGARSSLNSCLRVAAVCCPGAFRLCCCFSQAQPRRNNPRGEKYHRGRKEAIIAGCLFVANRMLKWQICKFVREGSLVFIFISQSGFLLAEQQARKRPILTT